MQEKNSFSVFLSLHFTAHQLPITTSIARRLYDSPAVWTSDAQSGEDKKTRERLLYTYYYITPFATCIA